MTRLHVPAVMPCEPCPVCGVDVDELLITPIGGVVHVCGHVVDVTITATIVRLQPRS